MCECFVFRIFRRKTNGDGITRIIVSSCFDDYCSSWTAVAGAGPMSIPRDIDAAIQLTVAYHSNSELPYYF